MKNEFRHLFRSSFSNINILLIYLARAKQAGIANRELISEMEEADIIARIEATIQFHYLILLFGNKLNPNYKWLEALSEQEKKDILYAISTHLSFHAITEKLVLSPIDLKSIYENPESNPSEMASVEKLLELPKESIISICNDRFNIFYIDKLVNLEKTVIFSAMSAIDAECFLSGEEEYKSQLRMDLDFPDANKVINHLLDFDYHQNIDNFLRFFAAKKMPQRFFTNLRPLVLKQIQILQHRFDLLKTLLEKEPSNVLDVRYDRFITNGFPLILICENDEAMTLINETTMEYRAQDPLRLGENVTMIATDTLENREIMINYLREHHVTSVSVVSFDQLRESKYSGIKPVGFEVATSRGSSKFSFAESSYQPGIFQISSGYDQQTANTAKSGLELV